MNEMYPASVNSVQTELAADITATQTTITLVDASVLPDAPNLLTIGGGENAETVRYGGKSGNQLMDVTRGFQGTAASWKAGTAVARYFTAYDADTMRENIANVISVASWQGSDIERSFSTMQTRYKEKKPLVTFIADDAPTSDLTKLKPIVTEKGVPIGIGVITSRVGTSGYMTYDEIKEMENAGCEIMCHSHNHVNLTTLTESEIDQDIRLSLSLMRENGFNPSGFIYPFNAHNDKTIKILRRYFNYSFSKPTGVTVGQNFPTINNHYIKRIALGSYFDQVTPGFPEDTSSLEYYKARVDEAVANNNWLVFVLHSAATDATQLQHIRDVIDYIRSLGVDIVSPSMGFDIYGNIIEVDGTSGRFVLDCSGGINSPNIRLEVDALNARKSTDVITSFPRNKVTITPTTNTFAVSENYPEKKGGVLETYRITTDYYHAFQRYIPTTGTQNVYERYVNSDYTWGAWATKESVETVRVSESNKYLASDSYAAYPYNCVTLTPYTSNGASSNGMPRAIAGLLSTERLRSDTWAAVQTYKTYKSAEPNGIVHEYVRYVGTDGNWTEWVLIKGLLRGITSNRPVNPTVGYCYIDTTVGKPIWYDGAKWIDAVGVSV